VLPLGEPASGVVLGRRRRNDLCPGQIGRASDPRPFPREVVCEVDPLGGDRSGGPLLLLDDSESESQSDLGRCRSPQHGPDDQPEHLRAQPDQLRPNSVGEHDRAGRHRSPIPAGCGRWRAGGPASDLARALSRAVPGRERVVTGTRSRLAQWGSDDREIPSCRTHSRRIPEKL
jgi:hypothetical protein